MDFPSWLISILSSEAFTTLALTTFAGIVTAVVGWVAIQFRTRILHDLSATDLALLRSIAAMAVQYAEQKFAEADGPTKLAEALKAANALIASYGLKVTVEQLIKIIEAAVYAETLHAELPQTAPVAPFSPAAPEASATYSLP
jgi:hypothetical protein